MAAASLSSTIRDFRYALRRLANSPGFTLTALITLGLGIGGAVAVFSVVKAVLLEPLPYADPERLVGLAFTYPQEKPNAEQAGISADFLREHLRGVTSVAVLDDSGPVVNLSAGNGRAEQLVSMHVSEGYFRTLGISPALGRTFTREEDRDGGGKSVVISHNLWAHTLNSDPNVVGRALRINQEPYTVIGVMPANLVTSAETAPGVVGSPDVWLPLQLSAKQPGYEGDNYEMIGRLAPGVTLAQIQHQLDRFNEPFHAQNPSFKKWTNEAHQLHVFRAWHLQDVVVSDVRRSLLVLMAAVAAVLLLACLNLSGLMMVRAMRRTRELTLCAALGATRWQLLRPLLAEGLLLACFSAVLAYAVARLGSQALLASSPLAIPQLHGAAGGIEMAGMVAAFAFAAVALFSVLPAWGISSRRGSQSGLRTTAVGESRTHVRLARILLVGQVALAMVLLTTASLLLGTFLNLRSQPSGVEPKQLSVFQVALKGERYANTRETARFVESVLDSLRHTPGVSSAAAISGLPLDRGLNISGRPLDQPNRNQTIEFRPVSAGYFTTMGIPLIAGRGFSDTDRAGTQNVALIGATAARKWWPNSSPIDATIRVGNDQNWRVIGVVADTQQHSLVESNGIVIYAPFEQVSDAMFAFVNTWIPTTFAVRTAAHVPLAQAARQAVERADPEIPVARFNSMQSVINSTIAAPRFFSMLTTCFSAFAVLLTVIGIFGLLSYQVTQRTREIGLRMAVGADRAAILRVFAARGIALASLGIALGLTASWLLRPIVTVLLSDAGLETSGPAAHVIASSTGAMAAAVTILLAAAAAASWLPARRASRLEPMHALRTE